MKELTEHFSEEIFEHRDELVTVVGKEVRSVEELLVACSEVCLLVHCICEACFD